MMMTYFLKKGACLIRWAVFLLAASLIATSASAETVVVKYRDEPVNLSAFVCHDITRSSFIHRVCYDVKEHYMIVLLNETYYHYCDIDNAVVVGFEGAMSMGKFYNEHIKGDGTDGPFDCRTHPHIPHY